MAGAHQQCYRGMGIETGCVRVLACHSRPRIQLVRRERVLRLVTVGQVACPLGCSGRRRVLVSGARQCGLQLLVDAGRRRGAAALSTVLGVVEASQPASSRRVEFDCEGLGVLDKSVIASPLRGNSIAAHHDVSQNPTELHALGVENPGAVAGLQDHGLHAAIMNSGI